MKLLAKPLGYKSCFFFASKVGALLFVALPVLAKSDKSTVMDSALFSDKPLFMMLALGGLSLLPFIAMMITSFVKIAVVLSITRLAIGTQQAPPTTVITGLALILTVYVMHPVGLSVYDNTEKYFNTQNKDFFDKDNVDLVFKAASDAAAPVKAFLKRHAKDKNVQMFYHIGLRISEDPSRALAPDDFLILVPSFVISELTRAFQIGFIIFLPFLVVDMAVANILMALGMQMLSPTTISLPFKILLFVLADGWHLITKGLVLGYGGGN